MCHSSGASSAARLGGDHAPTGAELERVGAAEKHAGDLIPRNLFNAHAVLRHEGDRQAAVAQVQPVVPEAPHGGAVVADDVGAGDEQAAGQAGDGVEHRRVATLVPGAESVVVGRPRPAGGSGGGGG
jgi:hypothetical protein